MYNISFHTLRLSYTSNFIAALLVSPYNVFYILSSRSLIDVASSFFFTISFRPSLSLFFSISLPISLYRERVTETLN